MDSDQLVATSDRDVRPTAGGGAGLLRRAWAALTERRGNELWDWVVRGSGVLGAAGLLLVAVAPATGPLVGFSVFTLWITGPLSPLFPTGYEPILMVMSRAYSPLLAAGAAMVTQLYVEFVSYHLYRVLLNLSVADGLRESAVVQRLEGAFERRPFLIVWFCALSPVPYWAARTLAALTEYPVGRFLTATVLGRFPKLWLFAALGVAWSAPSDALLLGVGLAALVLAAGAWAVRRWWTESGPRVPVTWRSTVREEPRVARPGPEQ